MALSTTGSGPHFRPPSNGSHYTPPLGFQAPFEDLFVGDWYMIRSSNGFWKDKRNIRLNYTHAGSHIEDQAFYQLMGSDTVKALVGKDIPSKDEIGVYTWQGKGLLRVASARWEVLCMTSRPEGDWMLVFQYKSIFTSPAINLMCRAKVFPKESDLQALEEWLPSVENPEFQKAVHGMVDIKQE